MSFDTDGGSTVADQTVEEGGKATKPVDPTKAGYAFDDWYEEDTYTTAFDFDTEIEADTTIYGKFLEVFTVTFNSDGGSAVTSQDVVDGGKATEPENPTKDGYTFGGWYKEDTLTTEFDFTTDTITEDTTLYAKWAGAEPEPSGDVTQEITDIFYEEESIAIDKVELTKNEGTGITTSKLYFHSTRPAGGTNIISVSLEIEFGSGNPSVVFDKEYNYQEGEALEPGQSDTIEVTTSFDAEVDIQEITSGTVVDSDIQVED